MAPAKGITASAGNENVFTSTVYLSSAILAWKENQHPHMGASPKMGKHRGVSSQICPDFSNIWDAPSPCCLAGRHEGCYVGGSSRDTSDSEPEEIPIGRGKAAHQCQASPRNDHSSGMYASYPNQAFTSCLIGLMTSKFSSQKSESIKVRVCQKF